MTKEEKRQILIEISARVPYGIKVQQSARYAPDRRHSGPDTLPHDYDIIGVDDDGRLYYDVFRSDEPESLPIENCVGQICRPYLRRMSSMTEEEKKEFDELMHGVEERCINAYGKGGYTLAFATLNDWLNAHHLDYRGSIDKGIALPATDDMYDDVYIDDEDDEDTEDDDV